MRRAQKIALAGAGLAILAFLAPRLYTEGAYRARIVGVSQAPAERVAIVFGAGLRRNGSPSPVLYDRVATAAELYLLGKADKLLLSGAVHLGHDEPEAMRQAALSLGVPDGALLLDGSGLRTYDTCFRAKALFGLRSALLVTQGFHLPRALFLCDALGITSMGVSADRRQYLSASLNFWHFREIFATAAAWWDVYVARPTPALDLPLSVQ